MARIVLCGFCLKKIAGPDLPELMFSRKPFRRHYRGPDMNPRIYKRVPLHKSSIPGIAALTVNIATHALFLTMSVIYVFAR